MFYQRSKINDVGFITNILDGEIFSLLFITMEKEKWAISPY